MPVTTIESSQIRTQAVQRSDLNVSTVGQAVVAKLLQGSNISLSSTGADAGTGDVTVSATVSTGPAGPTGPTGPPAYTNSTAGFTVPAVGSSITVNVNDTSWVALNEILWVQDATSPGTAGVMQVTAKTPTSLTLLNPYV